ncbi:hypothetical protein GGR57DRAFT_487447 [Xylariaceae sp. FL1272]|nr:hypothetical protein GGR57DRAFT_487447 [Xylariaceae sp. FL1272]
MTLALVLGLAIGCLSASLPPTVNSTDAIADIATVNSLSVADAAVENSQKKCQQAACKACLKHCVWTLIFYEMCKYNSCIKPGTCKNCGLEP